MIISPARSEETQNEMLQRCAEQASKRKSSEQEEFMRQCLQKKESTIGTEGIKRSQKDRGSSGGGLSAAAKNTNPPVKSPAKVTTTKTWEPLTFVLDHDQLPVNYSGVDPIKFIDLFRQKVDSIKKGEFETQDQFIQRTADKDSILSPIKITELYAFRIEGITATYDADTQAYTFGIKPPAYTCDINGGTADWATCKVTSIRLVSDSYTGSNAVGGSVVVQRTRGTDFSLALLLSNRALRTQFKEAMNEGFTYRDELAVPLEKARGFGGKTIAVLFIGQVTDAVGIQGKGSFIEPKFNRPIDLSISDYGVPFDLKRIIYYVVQTGEIIGQRTY
jgi:hypothetical protein